jgi:cell division protein FtsB
MPDSFWVMVGIVAPVLIMQVFQYLTMRANAKKSETDRTLIKQQIADVHDHVETIKTTKEETERMIAGAERQNIKAGIEIGKAQSSGPAPLGDA